MTTRVGINGFGRIGRQSLKALIERAPRRRGRRRQRPRRRRDERAAVQARLDLRGLRRRRPPRRPRSSSTVGEIKILAEKDPAACRGSDLGSTSSSSRPASSPSAEKARAHIDAGAQKVIISAPAKGEDITIVLGVNDGPYDPATHHIISNASVHDELPRPAAKVVHDLLGIERGADEHDPQLHERPAHPRRRAQGPAPRPRRRPEHHPDDDRRGEGARPRHPRPQGQVRRVQPARPDADGERRRLHRRRSVARPRSRSSTTRSAPPRRADGGHPRRVGRAARLDGLQGRQRSSIIDARSTMVLGGTWSRSSPGTTTSGATAAASPTSSRHVAAASAGRRLIDGPAGLAPLRTERHGQTDHPRRRRRGQARLRARRLQRPARRRQGHRRLAHPRRAADDQALLQAGAKVILASHLGRPNGKVPTASGCGRSGSA